MSAGVTGRPGRRLLQAPVHLYRWTLKPLMGHQCRHLPTCSAYALDAIELNGPWRGFWLAGSRVCRCHPWGSAGFDPAPDVTGERHRWRPWRYGRWGRGAVQTASPNASAVAAPKSP